MSSANFLKIISKCDENRVGPKAETRCTPQETQAEEEEDFAMATENSLSDRHEPSGPTACSSLDE